MGGLVARDVSDVIIYVVISEETGARLSTAVLNNSVAFAFA